MSGKYTMIAVLAFALSACATHQIHYTNPTAQAGATQNADQAFYLWGLVGGNSIDLTHMCPQGVAKIDSKSSFGDQLLTWFTAGLYSPMSVAVQCAAAPVTAGGTQ
jgi:hypothetical protein